MLVGIYNPSFDDFNVTLNRSESFIYAIHFLR